MRTPTGAGAAVRAPERLGEVEDAVHVGAPEGVDRLVRVAEGDQVVRRPGAPPVAGQRVQQPHLRRVGVLVLVDEDRVVLRRPAAPTTSGRSARSTARWTSSA